VQSQIRNEERAKRKKDREEKSPGKDASGMFLNIS